MQTKYDPDEALRITKVSAMFEGETYNFAVHNSGGLFMVMLHSHELLCGFFEKPPLCSRAEKDPCTIQHYDLKHAIRESIGQHQKKMHRLKIVT